jgi:hypothetical protein
MPTFDAGTSGLVGTVACTILNEAGAVHVPRTTAGITEPIVGSGVYHIADHDPTAVLIYVWDIGAGTICGSETLHIDTAQIDTVVDGIATTLASTPVTVTVTSPLTAAGNLTVYQGDDYAASEARSVAFLVADSGHALGLDGGTVVVKVKCPQATWTASSVASTTPGYTVTFTLTHAQTAALTMSSQRYELEATLANGHICTLATGLIKTTKDVPVVP